MKVELVVSSRTHGDDGVGECCELAAHSSSLSIEGGGCGSIRGGGGSAGQLRASPVVVPGRVGTCDNANDFGAQGESNLKLELEVLGPSSRTFDTG